MKSARHLHMCLQNSQNAVHAKCLMFQFCELKKKDQEGVGDGEGENFSLGCCPALMKGLLIMKA